MKDIYDLIQKKNSLPKGNVYKKIIKGKTYFYHQYSIDGFKHTELVKNNVDELIDKINERIVLEKEINQLLKLGNRNLKISKHAKMMTGYVMLKDEKVAEFVDGVLVNINEDKCPLIIKRTNRLEPFLKSRVIDAGRTNSRILKKVMSIKEADDSLVSLCSYGAVITDDYWFKPKNSKLKYKDVTFNNDLFFNVSLKGVISFYTNKIILTPELTTNGSYEKGWKNIDGKWWLYKVGTKNEIFSELFYSTLFELLRLPTAHYEKEGEFIKTLNFSENYNFEPMISIAGEDESYTHIYPILKNINENIAFDYLRLCFFDVVLNNIDRHNENCGLLRDKETGQIVSLAPNYDNNLCLISRTDNLNLSSNEGFLKQFINVLKRNDDLRQCLKNGYIPIIDENILNKCFDGIDIAVDKDMITKFILNRYKTLIAVINK